MKHILFSVVVGLGIEAVWGISDDGLSFAGQRNQQAVAITTATPLRSLVPDIPSHAWAVQDGVWVGAHNRTPFTNGVDLSLPAGYTGGALAVSRDSVAGFIISPARETFAAVWSPGLRTLPGLPNGRQWSVAWDATINGSTQVGFSTDEFRHAVMWQAGELVRLPEPGVASTARGVSPLGRYVVGGVTVGATLLPAVWDHQQLEVLAPLNADVPWGLVADVSDTGVMVGQSVGLNGLEAAVWIDGQVLSLREYTGNADWFFFEITGISADGQTLTGNGINPDGEFEAFMVRM